MSAAKVDFVPEALLEIEDAFEWYLERSVQAAEAFDAEIDSALALIATSPRLPPLFEAGTRRYVLPKFPYDVIYHEVEAGIEVVAVAHQKRRPRYWCSRLIRDRNA